MPHIYPIFRAHDNEVRAILSEFKTEFRKLVARELGYKMEDIAVIPRPIAPKDEGLSDNILRLEFIIDTGSRTVGEADKHKKALMEAFKDCNLDSVNFGIWIRPFEHSAFIEHKPVS